MLVRYVKFTAKKVKKKWKISSKYYDITQYVSSLSWGGSKDEVARKVTLTLVNAPTDPNIKKVTLNLGGMIYLYDEDGKTELFRGYIIDRERGSNATVSYTAYDLLYYTLRSKATYNFSNTTPEAVVKAVCKDMKINVGSIATTKKKGNFLVKDRSIYEIIMVAYTKATLATDIKYYVYTKEGELCVGKIGDKWFNILLSDASNVISTSTKESLSGVVNKVKVYDENNNVIKVVKNDESMVKYGTFQATYTKEKDQNPTTVAKSMLTGISRTLEIECIGYTGCTTGKCLKLKDGATGTEGKFYVEADTHTWKNGVHTMKLSLSLYNDMDVQFENS